ncbi:MAG: hypothetical protein RBT65_04100 [Methanolobus sp.]|nr:hypothetical protein [Methanolobus sp.]
MSGLIPGPQLCVDAPIIAHPQTVPFWCIAIRGNIRSIDVLVALTFEEFDGKVFNFGFGDLIHLHSGPL